MERSETLLACSNALHSLCMSARHLAQWHLAPERLDGRSESLRNWRTAFEQDLSAVRELPWAAIDALVRDAEGTPPGQWAVDTLSDLERLQQAMDVLRGENSDRVRERIFAELDTPMQSLYARERRVRSMAQLVRSEELPSLGELADQLDAIAAHSEACGLDSVATVMLAKLCASDRAGPGPLVASYNREYRAKGDATLVAALKEASTLCAHCWTLSRGRSPIGTGDSPHEPWNRLRGLSRVIRAAGGADANAEKAIRANATAAGNSAIDLDERPTNESSDAEPEQGTAGQVAGSAGQSDDGTPLPSIQSDEGPGGQGETVNDKMKRIIQEKPDAASWSIREWSEATGASISTIHGTPMWRTLKTTKGAAKLERMERDANLTVRQTRRANARARTRDNS